MVRKITNKRRLLALVLTIAMAVTFVLPAATFASANTATAVAVTVENGEEAERSNQIIISFNEMIIFDDVDWENNVKVSDGETDKIWGDGAQIVLNQTTLKDIVITLGTDSDVEVGDIITFENEIVKDAETQTEVFDESITIEGTFEPSAVSFDCNVEDAEISIEGYENLPSELGIGSFNYIVTAENYVTKTGSFDIEAADLGEAKKIEVTLEKQSANYTELDAAIEAAENVNAADYTTESVNALNTAVEAAKAVETELKFDEQEKITALADAITDAINNLVAWKDVSFMAVAVATDAEKDYAKADKIIVVFAEPIDENADVLKNLSIKDSVESAVWIDVENTVLELTLADNSDLKNRTEIEYTYSSDIRTKSGYVVKSYSTEISGNLEGAAEYVTATGMAATIVKADEKPGVNAGDKIVVVFNAPVIDKPESIEFTTDEGLLLAGTAVEGTDNTVYEILLSDNEYITDAAELSFGDIEGIKLNGSFGTADAPKVLKAYAIDNNGTAVTENDNIIIIFDRPTDGADVDLTKCVVTGISGASLGSNSTAEWIDDNTKLVITIGNTATIADGVTLDLENLNIKDEYELSSVVNTTVQVEGSFGYTIKPRITKAVAFTQNEFDYIRVFFNIEVKGSGTVDATISGFKTGVSAKQGLVDENGFTYYEIVMEKDEHGPFKSGAHTISLSGIVDKETGTEQLSSAPVTITGAFVVPITPELMSLTAVSQDGSGVVKPGDKIVAVFNTDVTIGDIQVSEGSFGSDFTIDYGQSGRNVVEITLGGDGINVVPNTTKIAFDGFKDYDTESVEMAKVTRSVKGSFGYSVEPKLLSATAVSRSGNGVPTAGDSIVLVFNTAVEGVTSGLGSAEASENGYVWTITLANTDVKLGDILSFNITSAATGESASVSAALGGSFGYSIEPEVLSATVVSQDGSGVVKNGDVIIFVLSNAVKSINSEIGTAQCDETGCVWTLTLNGSENVVIGNKLVLSVTTEDGNVMTLSPNLGGSFGYSAEPKILSLTAVSQDGSGVVKQGDQIIIVFNTAVELAQPDFGSATTEDGGYVWTVVINDINNIELGKIMNFSVVSKTTNMTFENVTAALGGNFGYTVNPEILSMTAVSNFGSGVAKQGDRIIIVFNTAVEGVESTLGKTEASANNYVWTITLDKDGSIETGEELSFNVTSAATGKNAYVSATLGGSFGYSEAATVKSVVLSENGGEEVITVVFSTATNMPAIEESIGMVLLKNNNQHLGANVKASWENEFVLKITLGSDATTTDKDVLDLIGLGITSAATGEEIQNINALKITGSLIPVVQSVDAADKQITVTFSTRTNGKADISKLKTLLGTGAKTEWSEDNKVLVITLGENYSISDGGYIVLNGMGIKDGFSETYSLVGQYKISGSIDSDKVSVVKAIAQSTDKSKVEAQSGDTIVIKFNTATNANGSETGVLIGSEGVDAIVSVAEMDNETAFGTGYDGEWVSYDTLVITLGGATASGEDEDAVTIGSEPQIAVGDTITVGNVAFASGDGIMDDTKVTLGGSFNGREFVVTNGLLSRTGSNEKSGDYRVSAKVENTLLSSVKPTIVCVAYSGNNAVAISRITVEVENSINPVFEFPASDKITSAEIYVFSDTFSDITSAPEVLAETLEIN